EGRAGLPPHPRPTRRLVRALRDDRQFGTERRVADARARRVGGARAVSVDVGARADRRNRREATRAIPPCVVARGGAPHARRTVHALMADVALVTCARLPEGDVDDHLFVDALTRIGLTSAFVCWDDPDARWPVAGMALVRSTWDYHERLDGFLGWAD